MKSRNSTSINLSIGWKLLLLILASIIIGALVYFGIIAIAFPAFSKDWNLLEGFASVLSLALLAGGLAFALTEYIGSEKAKEAEKAKLSYEIYNAIYAKLTDPEQEAARRWILSNINIKGDDEDITTWYEQANAKIMEASKDNAGELPEGQKAVKLALNCFDYIGFIASHYWDIEDDSLDWISAPIAKIWRRIGPYVLHVRALRKTTDYYLFAETVGDLCVAWRQKKGLPDEVYAAKTP